MKKNFFSYLKPLVLIENLMLCIVGTVIFAIITVDKIIKKILSIIEFVLLFSIFVFLVMAISELPQPWQSISIKSGILLGTSFFISLISLRLWRPDRLDKIVNKLLK